MGNWVYVPLRLDVEFRGNWKLEMEVDNMVFWLKWVKVKLVKNGAG